MGFVDPWLPTWNVTPVSLVTRTIAWPSSTERDIGFWQKTCLPAFIAAIAMIACQWSGAQIATASIVGSSITSRQSVTTRQSLLPYFSLTMSRITRQPQTSFR